MITMRETERDRERERGPSITTVLMIEMDCVCIFTACSVADGNHFLIRVPSTLLLSLGFETMICLWSSPEPCCCVKASCVSLHSTTDLLYIQHTIFKKNTGLTSHENAAILINVSVDGPNSLAAFTPRSGQFSHLFLTKSLTLSSCFVNTL
ncbi:hypothetical protein D9C73_007858 [Collichthys lucidus]|uniref:Uncharacterized protein n=1 Tax=Collichthys lucidus TaxID=240159 RepID=A0A4U5UGH8_COLLU|nr:hypothetical protein D9C73_007858 [Collichthys lucidus]